MPDALTVALAALFANPKIGRDAVYIAEGGAPVLVRIVARRADAVTRRARAEVGAVGPQAARDAAFRWGYSRERFRKAARMAVRNWAGSMGLVSLGASRTTASSRGSRP